MNQPQRAENEKTMDVKLGEILRDVGLITPEQMTRMIQEQERSGASLVDIMKQEVSLDAIKQFFKYEFSLPFSKTTPRSIGQETLQESGIITDQELTRALDMDAGSDRDLGQLLVNRSILTDEQHARAIAEQQRTGLPLWRVLLNLKMVSHSTISDLMKSRVGQGTTSAKEELILELLVTGGILSPDVVAEARSKIGTQGGSIIRHLIETNKIETAAIAPHLESALNIAFFDLKNHKPDEAVVFSIPEHVVRKDQILPLRKKADVLYLGMVDPFNHEILHRARMITGMNIAPCLIKKKDFEDVIATLFQSQRGKQSATELEDALRKGTRTGVLSSEDISAVQLATAIIDGAINDRATDIHLEPQIPEMRVRYRIDGLLYDVMSIPADLEMSVISRLKLLANMDITEKRRPQDGHFAMNLQGRELNFRLATIATHMGEKMTIRFLDESRVLTGLKQLGFEPDEMEQIEQLIQRPNGIILVTGPIGSGKTTTLYAALNQTNILNRNVVTIEDPVEYRLPGINQIQVNPEIGFDFQAGLRSILRHDADIIMVGEIRDPETARVATWAALTGQLVFCTLHTSDASSAVTMMTNLGVEHYLLGSALIGVIAQRLVRRLCPDCRVLVKPDAMTLAVLGLSDSQDVTIGKPVGCDKCFRTGYLGRTGIFEFLPVDQEIQTMIISKASDRMIRQRAIEKGMRTLNVNGVQKILQGITTPQEVLREIVL